MSHSPNALTPEQEREFNQILQGGLKGRFARGFCVLQGGIDALRRYLEQNTKPAVYAQAEELLQLMEKQLTELERLSDNAADLAGENSGRDAVATEWVEMGAYLRDLGTVTNRELAAQGRAARVEVQADAVFFFSGNRGRMNTLFANLLSNSVTARADAAITLGCTQDGLLFYRDNGPGPTAEQYAVLQGKTQDAVDCAGGTGLLMVAACARELGWELCPLAQEPGFALQIRLPAPQAPLPVALRSAGAGSDESIRQMSACLQREFAATLP